MLPTPLKATGQLPSSFRDPSGFVFLRDGVLLRQINRSYADDWQLLNNSGLYADLLASGLILKVEDAPLEWAASDDAVAVLRPVMVPFISYPYEWCFSQLKDAALVTLEIMRRSLEKGQWLKDASAYNIQFHEGKAIHIDTLSFEKIREGEPWPAYGQFCRHFLAPLAIAAYADSRVIPSLRRYLDGMPLDMVSGLLPGKTKFKPGLAMHLHMHAKATQSDAKGGGGKTTISKAALFGVIDSLKSSIEGLSASKAPSVWSGYYEDNNYAGDSISEKARIIDGFVAGLDQKPEICWDLGANTGQFSELTAKLGIQTYAFDFDPEVVESAYVRWKQAKNPKLMAFVQDLSNPSPSLGWGNQERESFTERGPADLVLALALIHHLAIGNNVPLPSVAEWFAKLGRRLIIEFVPKEDSQVQRMLSSRRDVFDNYTQTGFEEAFGASFKIAQKTEIPGTKRTLYLLESRAT